MRFLAVGAHPDDIDDSIGGIISRLAQRGHDIHYLICTDGSKGTPNMEEVPGLAAVRRDEQRAAAQAVGAGPVYFLEYIDGELAPSLALRRDMVRVIRTVQPDVVLAWDPTSYWIGDIIINHSDHRVAGQETLDAVYPGAGHATMFPELGLPAAAVQELWLYGSNHPTVFVDIASEFPRKLQALACHASQGYGDEAVLNHWLRDATRWVIRDFANPITARHPEHPEFIETFRRIPLNPASHIVEDLSPSCELHTGY